MLSQVSPTPRDEPPNEMDAVRAGQLPPRYGVPIARPFIERMEAVMAPGVRILDVGAGRSPTLPVEERPTEAHYVGLDIAPEEFHAAPPGAYDQTIVHDVTRPLPGQQLYDVILSWQVLEHVRPLDAALENLRQALRPGGALVAQLSGTFAVFALAARLMPYRLRVLAMERLLGHHGEDKFPSHYDHCYSRALERMLEPWSDATVSPLYRGAVYFNFAPRLQRAYLAYESLVARRPIADLATYYLISARR